MSSNDIYPRICAIVGCDKPVRNWRWSCCGMFHQKRYAAKCASNTQDRPLLNRHEAKEKERAFINNYMNTHPRKLYIPAWADRTKIRDLYREARRLTQETGVPHEVDHIIPVRGKTVTGLHCEANMRVITKAENRQKTNNFDDAV